MTLLRTEQIYLKSNSKLSSTCHYAKNLYNEANYFARQRFFNYRIAPNCNDMDKLMNGSALEPSENYIKLPAATAQWVLKTLNKSWLSFFRSIKDWKKHPNKYLGMPRPPNYLEKNGEYILIFTNAQFRFKDGYIHFPKKTEFKPVKTRLSSDTKINQVRIVPVGTGYNCEIIYEVKQKELNLNKNNILGIDIGISNIVTMVNNIGKEPIVIKGGILKSINQFYNKEMSRLQSIKDKQEITGTTSLQQSITQNRNNRIKDQMHKISRFIINYCIVHDIGTIVIGNNDNWKQNSNMGKKTNQNFISIPHSNLIHMIQYKGENVSINTISHEESYTSKCSFLDNEPICHHSTYLGTRIKRGLFKTASGILINADVNAGYNIIKKALPKTFVDGIGALGLMPVSVSLANRTINI
ncbi:transposase [Candidatus Dependentiae bacterium]|nr:transposase [Candidatus Dependentiae bacterium]